MALGNRQLLGRGRARRRGRRGRRVLWLPIYVPRRWLRAALAGAGAAQLPEHGGEAEHLPEWGYGDEDFPVHLPEYDEEGEEIPPGEPIHPGLPGEPAPRACLPVVRAVELEDGGHVPSGQPELPGQLCIVYVDQERPKALAWLQGESDLPLALHAEPEHTPAPAPEGEHEFRGHWVRVETTPSETDHDGHHDEATLGWAYVFEIGGNFGKGRFRERVRAAVAGRAPQRPAPGQPGQQPAGH